MRRSEPDTRKTYASLRVMGDDLDPEQVTRILRVVPTTAYAKGDKYPAAGGRELIGRTGVWLLSTDGLVASDNLHHHLAFILGILVPGRQDVGPLTQLHSLLAHRKRLSADIGCFWHGRFGAKRPSVPRIVSEIAKLIPADVETDFDTDSEEADRRRA
jgi:hypothetical protein